ncbi:hypothetical protein T02_10914 [Trichinella nativa]|uniref:Uncharacterized protein n=1 Tax=Trichinella nativa TaxID=6335 RepID=A0A0V1L7J4_9BILA|nr:hypothetical protein T02_10914 [Trichinella nativa]
MPQNVQHFIFTSINLVPFCFLNIMHIVDCSPTVAWILSRHVKYFVSIQLLRSVRCQEALILKSDTECKYH